MLLYHPFVNRYESLKLLLLLLLRLGICHRERYTGSGLWRAGGGTIASQKVCVRQITINLHTHTL